MGKDVLDMWEESKIFHPSFTRQLKQLIQPKLEVSQLAQSKGQHQLQEKVQRQVRSLNSCDEAKIGVQLELKTEKNQIEKKVANLQNELRFIQQKEELSEQAQRRLRDMQKELASLRSVQLDVMSKSSKLMLLIGKYVEKETKQIQEEAQESMQKVQKYREILEKRKQQEMEIDQ